jgi:hypothetical protein
VKGNGALQQGESIYFQICEKQAELKMFNRQAEEIFKARGCSKTSVLEQPHKPVFFPRPEAGVVYGGFFRALPSVVFLPGTRFRGHIRGSFLTFSTSRWDFFRNITFFSGFLW